MRVLRDLRRLLPRTGFRRLLGARLLGQCADGVFAAALTASVLFAPERQTTPGAIAVATAATLLPFSVVGPFAGVALDRWSRRDVLVAAPLVRTVLAGAVAALLVAAPTGSGADATLFALVVAGFAVNRFVLSALSAALPHTVAGDDLLSANAVVPTAGTIAYTAGLGLGGLWHGLLGGPDVATLAPAGLLWLLAGAVASRFGRRALGPPGDREADRAAGSKARGGADAVRGLVEGLHHLRSRPPVGQAIVLVGLQRALAGTTVVAALLLHRSTYAVPGDPAAGLAGLGLTVAAVGVGVVLAAVAVPSLVARSSMATAMAGLLLAGAAAQAAFAATGAEGVLVVAALVLGTGGHALKIGADTLVQTHVADDYRGRVFSLYDLVFNAGLVSATVLGALTLPVSGHAPGVMAAVAVGLAALALAAARVLPRAPVGAPAG